MGKMLIIIAFVIFSINFIKTQENIIKSYDYSSNFENILKSTLKKYEIRNEPYQKGEDGGISYNKTKDLPIDLQFQNDIVMMYKTLFPETIDSDTFYKNENNNTLALLNLAIVQSLKRILFTMTDLGLHFSYEENLILNIKTGRERFLWPFPLATSLCHGSRTIFIIDKSKLNGRSVMEYFFEKDYSLLYKRPTASHKVEATKSYLFEKKIVFEAAMDWFKNLFDVESSPHYGMNIPLGGIGNYWPNKIFKIHDRGHADKGKNNNLDLDPLQHGHLYVRYDELENFQFGSILLGIEEDAPNYKGMFSKKVHNFLNALEAPTTSVCGGAKWKSMESVLRSRIPHNYGGKAVYLNKFPDEQLFNKIEKMEENLKKKIWWIMLSLNSQQLKIFKEKYLYLDNEALNITLKKLEE